MVVDVVTVVAVTVVAMTGKGLSCQCTRGGIKQGSMTMTTTT